MKLKDSFATFADEILVNKEEMQQFKTDLDAKEREKDEESATTNNGPNLESEDA